MTHSVPQWVSVCRPVTVLALALGLGRESFSLHTKGTGTGGDDSVISKDLK